MLTCYYVCSTYAVAGQRVQEHAVVGGAEGRAHGPTQRARLQVRPPLRMPYALTYAHVCLRMPPPRAHGLTQRARRPSLRCTHPPYAALISALLLTALLYSAVRCIRAARNRPVCAALLCFTLLYSALLCCQVHLRCTQPAYVRCFTLLYSALRCTWAARNRPMCAALLCFTLLPGASGPRATGLCALPR